LVEVEHPVEGGQYLIEVKQPVEGC
jgi:hypothetical protein